MRPLLTLLIVLMSSAVRLSASSPDIDFTDDGRPEVSPDLTILGDSRVSVEAMWTFVAEVNPDFDPAIAEAYYRIGERYGIRGDVALCQAVIETGWFTFSGGTAVTPDQHNYCGLGVTRLGLRGHSFADIEEGITAQMQHLYAYATNSPLPKGERRIDPRFQYVKRATAPRWADLDNRWAASSTYGASILKLYAQLLTY